MLGARVFDGRGRFRRVPGHPGLLSFAGPSTALLSPLAADRWVSRLAGEDETRFGYHIERNRFGEVAEWSKARVC